MNSSARSKSAVTSDRLEEYSDDIQLMYDDVEFSLEQLTHYGEPVIFKGAPGVGKTTSLFNVAYEKNQPVTYLAARIDMYEAAEQKALEAGFKRDNIAVVPAPHRACPTFLGHHGEALEAEYKSLHSVGVSIPYLHTSTSIQSPCHSDTKNCPYMMKRIEDPDEYEVIIGHYRHALNTQLIRGRLTFVDEFAEDDSVTLFTATGGDDEIRIGQALNPYFHHADFLPWRSFEDFVASIDNVTDPTTWASEVACQPEGLVVDDQTLLEMDPDDRFHKKAPLIVFGLLVAEDLGNGWYSWTSSPGYAQEFDDLSEHLAIVRNDPGNFDNLEVLMLEPTDLSAASQVIGLDGTARKRMWDTIFVQDFAVEEFIGPDQMMTYVEDVQGMDLWQSTEAARPYSSGQDVYDQADAATILYTKLVLDDPFVITTKKAASILESEIETIFSEDVREVMNFAEVRSNNEAAGTAAIYSAGSPHPGDNVFERWGALMGEGVERVPGTQGTDVRYTPESIGREIYGHFVLDKIEQAIMRGRRSTGDETGSTVVLGTGCRPEWFSPSMEINVLEDSPLKTKDRRELIRYIAEEGEATSDKLDAMADFSKEARRNFVNELESRGWLTSNKQPGPKPTVYIWHGPCQ